MPDSCRFGRGTLDACCAPATVAGPPRAASFDADGCARPQAAPALLWCADHAARLADLRAQLSADGRAKRAPRLATSPVTVRFTEPRKVTPKRVPIADRALAMARVVWAADGPVSRADLAAAVGMAPSSLTRAVRVAAAAGWFTGQLGGVGGYVRGSVRPPDAE